MGSTTVAMSATAATAAVTEEEMYLMRNSRRLNSV